MLAANYPFATIEPNVGVVGVPTTACRSSRRSSHAKVLPATVEFVDIAGIVAGASQGEGLGNKFLSHIRESAAICQVTRVFRDEDVTHVDGEVNPANDISTIQTELILADLQTVEKAIPRLEKEARGNKAMNAHLDAAREALSALETGTPISATRIDRSLVRELSLLTAKPFIYVFNCDADELADEALKAKMQEIVAPAEAIFLDAKFESELVELGDDDEARAMLAEMGVDEPGLDVLARVGFDTLGLQTYLTAGPKETRAWTISQGATAPEAAGVIHTDFQRGFIKAEVVSFDDLIGLGSMQKAKEAGKVRMEGKDYVMADGDVVGWDVGGGVVEVAGAGVAGAPGEDAVPVAQDHQFAHPRGWVVLVDGVAAVQVEDRLDPRVRVVEPGADQVGGDRAEALGLARHRLAGEARGREVGQGQVQVEGGGHDRATRQVAVRAGASDCRVSRRWAWSPASRRVRAGQLAGRSRWVWRAAMMPRALALRVSNSSVSPRRPSRVASAQTRSWKAARSVVSPDASSQEVPANPPGGGG